MLRSSLVRRYWPSWTLEATWLLAAVAVPLVFNPWGTNSFELPKAALLRALVLLMVVATLARAFEGERGEIPHSLLWPVLALGLAFVLATVLSVNPRVSLWGSYERQQGLITISAYLLLFFLTAWSLSSHAQAERLWAALVWGSAPVVAYGLAQAVGLDPLSWQIDTPSPVLSTIGRPNFLGSMLVLVLPLTAGRLLATRRRWLYGPLLAGQLACLALTQARGAWVGLGVAGVGWGLAWAVANHSRRTALATMALAVLAVALVALLNWPSSPLAPLARLPGLARLATLARTDEGSVAARLTIWRTTMPLLAARPWLGYGPETMRPLFLRVFPPQLVYYQGRGVAVDRAHNLWLDLGMSTGLAGVLALAALLAGCGWLAWRGLRQAEGRWERIAWTALVAAVAGHLADLQFGFDLTASATIFWLTLALAAALSRGLRSGSSSSSRPIVSPLLSLPPALAALALAGFLCLRPLLADVAFHQSRQGARGLAERLSLASRAVRLWPLEPEHRMGLAWVAMEGGDLADAAAQMEAAAQLSPDDAQLWAARGELYAAWGEVNPAGYTWAEMAYRQALALAPDVAAYHTALGLALGRQGRLEEGAAELERAVALDSTAGTAYGHLADLYATLGRETEAEWARREAERWGEGQ